MIYNIDIFESSKIKSLIDFDYTKLIQSLHPVNLVRYINLDWVFPVDSSMGRKSWWTSERSWKRKPIETKGENELVKQLWNLFFHCRQLYAQDHSFLLCETKRLWDLNVVSTTYDISLRYLVQCLPKSKYKARNVNKYLESGMYDIMRDFHQILCRRGTMEHTLFFYQSSFPVQSK